MNDLFDIRETLGRVIQSHKAFFQEEKISTSDLDAVLEQLRDGELSVAVVGEINRGKSTFLNALLGHRVFPSRASVCTAGLTILDSGEAPSVEVTYFGKKAQHVPVGEDLMETLTALVSRKNPKAREIENVYVRYPNPFTGKGILLIDTPGVNDPNTWREEITYNYLANADAVIMLLDPMQPLSASEREFLVSKILGQSIMNLIFVVNRIDDVPISDRQVALERIETLLETVVPHPRIYTVSSKQGLKAKMSGDSELLRVSGFPLFEQGLLDFLARGRAGMLLHSKIARVNDILRDQLETYRRRLGALDLERGTVEETLARAEKELKRISTQREELRTSLNQRKKRIQQTLHGKVVERESYWKSSLRAAVRDESDETHLRDTVFAFQRDTVAVLRIAFQDEYQQLMGEFGAGSSELHHEMSTMLHQLNSDMKLEFTSSSSGLSGPPVAQHSAERVAATVGGGVGAVGGMTAAAGMTTSAVTATGAVVTTSAFSTLGVLGVGLLGGAIGLIAGVGLLALVGKRSETQNRYISQRQLADNNAAVQAMDRFLANLKGTVDSMTSSLLQSVQSQLLDMIEDQEQRQADNIRRIREDLQSTDAQQVSLRKDLKAKLDSAKPLEERYSELMNKVERIALMPEAGV